MSKVGKLISCVYCCCLIFNCSDVLSMKKTVEHFNKSKTKARQQKIVEKIKHMSPHQFELFCRKIYKKEMRNKKMKLKTVNSTSQNQPIIEIMYIQYGDIASSIFEFQPFLKKEEIVETFFRILQTSQIQGIRVDSANITFANLVSIMIKDYFPITDLSKRMYCLWKLSCMYPMIDKVGELCILEMCKISNSPYDRAALLLQSQTCQENDGYAPLENADWDAIRTAITVMKSGTSATLSETERSTDLLNKLRKNEIFNYQIFNDSGI